MRRRKWSSTRACSRSLQVSHAGLMYAVTAQDAGTCRRHAIAALPAPDHSRPKCSWCVAGARERIQRLPDSQRHQAAADIAMSMAAALGISDDSSDSEV